MTLFRLGKKKEEKKNSACCCGSAFARRENASFCSKSAERICCVKVLGAGCKNCHALLAATKKAVQNIGRNIEVEYITDMEKIAEYGVMRTPALVINEQIVSMGRVLNSAEIEKMLNTYGG